MSESTLSRDFSTQESDDYAVFNPPEVESREARKDRLIQILCHSETAKNIFVRGSIYDFISFDLEETKGAPVLSTLKVTSIRGEGVERRTYERTGHLFLNPNSDDYELVVKAAKALAQFNIQFNHAVNAMYVGVTSGPYSLWSEDFHRKTSLQLEAMGEEEACKVLYELGKAFPRYNFHSLMPAPMLKHFQAEEKPSLAQRVTNVLS